MALPTYTAEMIGDYVANGHWETTDGTEYSYISFDAEAGDTLYVYYGSLNSTETALAEAAFEAWSIVTGITFAATNFYSISDIDLDNSGSFYAGGGPSSLSSDEITSASVTISTDWTNTYGGEIGDYSFQTYVHEIGHALGLGHSGDYDGTGNFDDDAHYANDSWQMSIMSYFSADENPNVDGSLAYVVTPMIADIEAMEILYGTSTDVRSGDTVWGANSTVDGYLETTFDDYFAGDLTYDIAFTIHDTDGTDTIDLSTVFDDEQTIDLREGGISSVNGAVGNMVIANGTVIENVIGGYAADTIIGNSAANTISAAGGDDIISGRQGDDFISGQNGDDSITGGNGDDIIYGGRGADSIWGQAGDDRIIGGQDDDTLLAGGNGNDTIYGQEGDDKVWGGSGSDTITGDDGADILNGHAGNDDISGGTGKDTIYGGNGIDTITGGNGNDSAWGGNGGDTLKGGNGADMLSGQNGNDKISGGNGTDTIYGGAGADKIWGQAGNDVINGQSGSDTIWGGSGNDTINGGYGADFIGAGNGDDSITGGNGNDTMYGGAGADVFIFGVNFGSDVVEDIALPSTATGSSDTLQFDDAIWGGDLTAQDVVDTYANIVGANVEFDFGEGNTITFTSPDIGDDTTLADFASIIDFI